MIKNPPGLTCNRILWTACVLGVLGCGSSTSTADGAVDAATRPADMTKTYAPGSQPAWAACNKGVDCQTGLSCDVGDPNGQCYASCSKDADCAGSPGPATCNSEGHCYQLCQKTSDCPRASEGYVCISDSPAGTTDAGATIMFCDGPGF